jgi:hypothetical protein
LTPLRSIILLAALACVSASAAESGDDKKTAPLFRSHDVLEITINAPIRQLMRDRPDSEYLQGTLSYEDPEAGETTLDIGIRTRGRFRRQTEVCPFAPLRLNFRKTKGTLFAKSDKLKMVTHCRSRSKVYTQAILKEYLAYRILNTLTENSFRVRLLRVTYFDNEKNKVADTNYAFLIEHRDQLAKRIGREVSKAETTVVSALDGQETNISSVFQYIIGNTDFSPIKGVPGEPCCHNYVLMEGGEGKMLSIPYDFDVTGIVDAPYAVPNPRFRLRDVRQRMYRGRCVNNEYLDSTLQLFMDRKQAIYDLLDSVPGLNNRSIKKSRRYIDEFYATIESPKRVERYIVGKCLR